MKQLMQLVARNTKLYFKDKMLFFTSLLTPLILLVLYVTFLGNVYRNSFSSNLPEFMNVPEKLIDAAVGGQLISSLLAVCCVTVAFCSNLIVIQDKYRGSYKDLLISPVKRQTLAVSYYIGTFLSTLAVCGIAAVVGFVYLAVCGWYLSVADVLLICLDVLLLILFGTALSSIVSFFLSTEGQASAVGTIVSAGYGFISGAYMPISQFSAGLQRVISFLPGTYATSLIRNHMMRGVFAEMEQQGFPDEVVDGIMTSIDCNLSFFDHPVGIGAMYAVLGGSVVLLLLVYVLLNTFKKPVTGN